MKQTRIPPTGPDCALELQGLLNAAVDGVIVIDHMGTIQSFNRAAERLFGYSANEVIGTNVSVLMVDADRDTHDRSIAEYTTTRVPHIIGRGREVSAKRKDGTVFAALLAVVLVPESRPPRFVGFIHDNTARRQSEIEAHRLQERLMHVSRLATVGEMASGIAHELNQPLAAIATYAHACERLLNGSEPDIPEVQAALRQIADQAIRAGDIIRKLRNLAGSDHPSRAPADVNSLINELTGLIEADAKAHGVNYRRDLASSLPQVVLDRSQIQQVVMNLVHNSMDALALGQIDAAELIIRTRRTDSDDVEIAVCDNGPGVQSSIEKRMFDPFCTTKPTGTGLGLPMSRTIVRAHDGTLDYEPNEPRGATFTVMLPAAAAGNIGNVAAAPAPTCPLVPQTT
ncbi:MAG TPA: PAS domain S-box protein [Steroidobacteraceae bacterium]